MGDNVFVIHHNASTSRNEQDCLINEPRKITALDGQGLCPVSNKNNPVHTCRLVCLNGGYICHCGHSFFCFVLNMYLWWSFCTLYLLARQVELPWAIQVFVAVSLVCQALLTAFVDSTQALSASFCSTLQQFTLRLTCKCVYVCVYMLSQFRDQTTKSDLE